MRKYSVVAGRSAPLLVFNGFMVYVTLASNKMSDNDLVAAVEACKNNGDATLKNCTNSAGELISNWDVGDVTNMAYLFSGLNNFNADISEWVTDNVEVMDGLFNQCANFDGDLSRWKTRRVTSMTNMFYGATKFGSNVTRKAPYLGFL